MRLMFRWRSVANRMGLWLIGLLASSVSMAAVPPATATLFDLIQSRLALMEQVAAAKWPDIAAIDDPAREQTVLNQAAQAAEQQGLSPSSVEAFFTAQMVAAKHLQQQAFARWQADPSSRPTSAPNLVEDLRPRLNRLGAQIASQIALIGGGHPLDATADDLATHLAGLGLDRADSDAIYQGLRAVERRPSAPASLARLIDSGVLRVGTTFDYAPFSALDPHSGDPVGIDIDLAHHLADSLGLRLEFVATTWPTLMEDLQADRFDLALSGISRTLARQRHAFFSAPYHTGGKVAFGRCQDQSRFNSLDAIDQPGVRIIVNPGGANQQFVETHLHQAKVMIHPDNTTIFDALAAGQADVMITDWIEAHLQRQIHPELCLLADETLLTHQDKAALLSADPALKFYLDLWLETLRRDGMLDAIFRRHLGEHCSDRSGSADNDRQQEAEPASSPIAPLP